MTDGYVPDVSLSERDDEDDGGAADDAAGPAFGAPAENGASATGAAENGTADDESVEAGGGPESGAVPDIEHPDAADDDEVEPVELLVQLAEEGEIEPWDIDIVQVTDAFLEKLDATDLRTSGRALFYASVLLRMKGDEMMAEDDADDEPDKEPWETAMEGGEPAPDADFDPVSELEAEMDRRLERKSTRGSPETLDELVRELRDAERGTWWKDSREYDTSASPQGYDRGTQTVDYRAGDEFRGEHEPTQEEVTGGTHDEDIEEVIEDVRAALDEQYGKGREEVLFAEVADAGGRSFMTFLALLFLAHRGGVELRQDEFFGDLWIRDPAAATGEAEAVAD
ncbi:segregation and condensation protein A [Haloparvum sedimenti]|uniref:segregation and condensation protein A n=1 Tax=Haloparvum sedimenti TaxID=1678448 RepID=UPI00071E992A|nr:ScpA family protein [Haloparvum sedimenti]